MTMTAERKANMQKASKASSTAKRRLIELHREEYEAILGDQRVALGLPREVAGGTQKLQARKERLEAQLKTLNEKLGVTSTT